MYDIFFVLDPRDDFSTWTSFKERYPHARLIDKNRFSYRFLSRISMTKMFWTVDSDVLIKDSWNFDFVPEHWDSKYLHIWPSHNHHDDTVNDMVGYGSIRLWPSGKVADDIKLLGDDLSDFKIKLMDDIACYTVPHDIFMITYEEPNGDENWKRLSSRFTNAKRIHGIKGIHNAHLECAKRSETEMFWTIDGDTILDDSWNFGYYPPTWDRDYLHLWQSRNPVNGLVYGYGSVKLWPKNRVMSYNGKWLDFTTTVGKIKMMNEVISTTNFNSSEYETWKSAFRECTKLQFNINKNPTDEESKARLDTWLSVAIDDAQYSSWALQGAKDSLEWFRKNKNQLAFINDFSWLRTHYQSLYLNER